MNEQAGGLVEGRNKHRERESVCVREIWPRGYKTFFQLSMKFKMIISIKISRNSAFFRLR